MSNVIIVHAHWSFHQKLNSVSLVQLRRSVRAIRYETRYDLWCKAADECATERNVENSKNQGDII